MSFSSTLDPVTNWISEGIIARAAAVVLHDGNVVAERYWGSAADGGAIDADTLLPFASLTKPALATVALRLVERGVLTLDLTLGEVIADAPAAVRGISVAQLLTHSSGFPEHVPGTAALEARRAPVSDYVRATLEAELMFAPGTRVLYSNAGFQVLGAIVELVAGVPVPEVMEREVFAPVGMMRATMRPLARPGARVARTELGARAGDPATDIYNSPYFRRLGRADAGLFATPRDVAALLELYRQGGCGVLTVAMSQDAITSHTHGIPGKYGPYTWESCDFGWGWEVKNGKAPHPTGARTSARTFGHIGNAGALAFCDPERAISVVIHTLRDFGDGWAAERPYLARVAGALIDEADRTR
jgi:CubicO group peptidase (beta-lactamase class C family)